MVSPSRRVAQTRTRLPQDPRLTPSHLKGTVNQRSYKFDFMRARAKARVCIKKQTRVRRDRSASDAARGEFERESS